VTLNGDDIYEFKLDQGLFKIASASLWHVVPVPDHSTGSTLEITYQSPYDKMNGLINPVMYGTHGDLMFYVLEKYGQPFLIDVLILLFGIIMLIIAFIIPKNMYNNIWYIGLFAVVASLWMIGESRMLQFFTGNERLLGSLPFISIALISIPFVHYIKNIVSDPRGKILEKIIVGNWGLIGLIITLQVLDIADFFETLILSHLYMVLIIVVILNVLYKAIKLDQNNTAKHTLYAILSLFVFFAIEVCRFYFLSASDVTVLVRLGIMVFIILLSQETAKQVFKRLKKSHQSEFYEKMAYLDQLTQGPNRMAFEQDLDGAFNNLESRMNLRLVILDMNQLKNINDTHGHITGDDAIRTSYNLIDQHFGTIGKSYRIGGDEFACIIPTQDTVIFEQACSDFDESIKKYNDNLYYPLGIALGSVIYDPVHDKTVKLMMHRADTNMYKAKRSTINLA
jgi:diguanylate cyclase (GGDEF)-like protein